MHKPFISIALAIVFVGCGGERESKYSLDNAGVDEVPEAPPILSGDRSQGLDFGIGDVESALRIETFCKTEGDNISQQVIENKREIISKAETTVSFPFPDELLIRVGCRSVKDYPEGSSARITLRLYLGNEVIETFTAIFDEAPMADPQYRDFDIMPHLDLSQEDTFLLHSRGEIEYFPKTPASELTVDSEATPDVTRTTKLGNPLRITFQP